MTFLSKLKYFLMSFEMLFVFAIEQQNSCQIQNHFTIVELLIRSHILFRSFRCVVENVKYSTFLTRVIVPVIQMGLNSIETFHT